MKRLKKRTAFSPFGSDWVAPAGWEDIPTGDEIFKDALTGDELERRYEQDQGAGAIAMKAKPRITPMFPIRTINSGF